MQLHPLQGTLQLMPDNPFILAGTQAAARRTHHPKLHQLAKLREQGNRSDD